MGKHQLGRKEKMLANISEDDTEKRRGEYVEVPEGKTKKTNHNGDNRGPPEAITREDKRNEISYL